MSHYLLYDDSCSLCQGFRDWVVKRDTRKRIEPVGFLDPRLSEIAPGLTSEKLFGSMHLVLPGGEILSGHRAIPKLLELLPGSDWLSRKIYHWIAAHRR